MKYRVVLEVEDSLTVEPYTKEEVKKEYEILVSSSFWLSMKVLDIQEVA